MPHQSPAHPAFFPAAPIGEGLWRPKRLAVAVASALVVMGNAWAANTQDPTWLSLEELMAIEVSSAAKRPQRLADASTAIHAIGRDEIRRSGATNLPELLRTVPGVQVSRIDASRYAISIRGFSNRYSGKLLVLQDGRSLYNPLFSGTYWEAQDLLLEDIERIEVIRGSGGTLWGANAVNGVINIITRHAHDSQGSFAEAKAGSLESGAAIRHGGTLGDNGHFRAYAKVDAHRPMDTATGAPAHDQGSRRRAGFKAEITPQPEDTFTVQGDIYRAKADQSALKMSEQTLSASFVPDTAKLDGANVLMRWERNQGDERSWHLQAYLDHANLSDVVESQQVDTLDVEWQQRLKLSEAQNLTWGLGARRILESLNGSFTVSASPADNSSTLYSGFIQDEIQLNPDVLLTLGSKLEHNNNTGYEAQPSARMLWQATPTDNFWGAISRAVQTPTIATTNAHAHVGTVQGPYGPMVLKVRGNPNIKSETMVSREVGYRGQFGSDLNLDATAFYNTYDNVVQREFGQPEIGRYITVPINFFNNLYGKTYGVELAGNWQVMPHWRLHGSYSWLKMDLKSRPGSTGIGAFGDAAASPRQMAQIHSVHNLSNNIELDANLYFVDKLSFQYERGRDKIPASTQLDLRIGWHPSPNLEISLTGRNLLTKSERAYRSDDVVSSHIPRSVLAQIRWKY